MRLAVKQHISIMKLTDELTVHSYIFFAMRLAVKQHISIMKLSGSNTQHIFMIGILKDVVAGSNAQHVFFTMNPSPLLW